MRFETSGEVVTFHRPHPAKDAKRYQVRDARDFLERIAGIRDRQGAVEGVQASTRSLEAWMGLQGLPKIGHDFGLNVDYDASKQRPANVRIAGLDTGPTEGFVHALSGQEG